MPKSKNIILFHPSLPPYRIDLFNYLVSRFNVRIYLLHKNLVEQNLNQNLLMSQLLSLPKYSRLVFRLFRRTFALDIIPILITQKPTLVLTTEFGLTTQQVFLYRFLFSRNLRIFLFTDDNTIDSKNRKGLSKWFRDFISIRVDGVIYTSEEVERINLRLVDQNIRSFVCPIIHSEEKFKFGLQDAIVNSNSLIKEFNLYNKKVLISVGRLVESKNIIGFLNSLNNLDLGNLVVFVIGEGPELNALKLTADSFGLNIHFMGKKEGRDLLAFYNIAQILVFPTRSDRFGAVVGEALMGGVKVVCSNVAGAASLINKKNGILVDPLNGTEISDGINRLLESCEPVPQQLFDIRQSLLEISLENYLSKITETW